MIGNLSDAIPIMTADTTAIPGICPSTPLLQLSIFITQTIQAMARRVELVNVMERNENEKFVKERIPPSGFVMKGISTPENTIIAAHIKLPKKRTYGERSYLSSRTPIITTSAPAAIIDKKVLSSGKNRIMARIIAKKMGIPPARGNGFL